MTTVTASDHSQESSDPLEYRRVLSHYPTGVVVVTATVDGRPEGMVAGSFLSISLHPPLVGFCADHGSTTWPRLREAGAFVVNVLGADQQELSRTFSRKGLDRFEGQDWTPDADGHPVLSDCPVRLSCRLETVHVIGDHDLVVGRVRELGVQRHADPLIFLRGGYTALGS